MWNKLYHSPARATPNLHMETYTKRLEHRDDNEEGALKA